MMADAKLVHCVRIICPWFIGDVAVSDCIRLSWQRDVMVDEVTCQQGRLMDAPSVAGVALNLHIYTTPLRRRRRAPCCRLALSK